MNVHWNHATNLLINYEFIGNAMVIDILLMKNYLIANCLCIYLGAESSLSFRRVYKIILFTCAA